VLRMERSPVSTSENFPQDRFLATKPGIVVVGQGRGWSASIQFFGEGLQLLADKGTLTWRKLVGGPCANFVGQRLLFLQGERPGVSRDRTSRGIHFRRRMHRSLRSGGRRRIRRVR